MWMELFLAQLFQFGSKKINFLWEDCSILEFLAYTKLNKALVWQTCSLECYLSKAQDFNFEKQACAKNNFF